MVLYGLRRSNQALTLLAPESWKSASSQNVSQIVSTGLIGSKKVISGFNSIGTGILEVCEYSKRMFRTLTNAVTNNTNVLQTPYK